MKSGARTLDGVKSIPLTHAKVRFLQLHSWPVDTMFLLLHVFILSATLFLSVFEIFWGVGG